MRSAEQDIAIDITRVVVRTLRGRLPTGIDRVCVQYASRLDGARAVLHKAGIGKVLSPARSRTLFGLLSSPPEDIVRRLRSAVVGGLLDRPAGLRPGSTFLNVGHTGLERGTYLAWLRRRRLQAVFMVHDLIPITHPEYCRDGEGARHERRVAAMLELGKGLIINSAATHDVLCSYAGERGLKLPPSVVAPLAGADLPDASAMPLLDEPYFLMVGTIEPRKNHAMVLQLWRELAEQWRRGAVPRLVLVGQRGWDVEHIGRLLARCGVLRHLVIERPVCGDAELATWLRHARALLFPSFAEGYGLPLVEALSIGTPVIASDLAVFREIAGDFPEYLHPLDGIGWLDAVVDYAGPGSLRRARQIERMRDFMPPTWKHHHEIVDALLARLAGAPDA